MPKLFAALPAAAAALAVALAGCSAPSPAPTAAAATETVDSATDHSPEDALFAQTMLPHREQGAEMAEILLAKPGIDGDVADVARQVGTNQSSQAEQLGAWLETQGEPTSPEQADEGLNRSIEGLLSDEEMDRLRDAPAGEAERIYLAGMIQHHQGAVSMAQQQVSEGFNDQAVGLARQMVDHHREEIGQMEQLLSRY